MGNVENRIGEMKDGFIRGDTNSITMRLDNSGVEAKDVTNAYFTIRQGSEKKIYEYGVEGSGVTIDNDHNLITKIFSQEDTLALKAGIRVYMEFSVLDKHGNRKTGFCGTMQVYDTEYDQVLEPVRSIDE